jgi:hypothetical protein
MTEPVNYESFSNTESIDETKSGSNLNQNNLNTLNTLNTTTSSNNSNTGGSDTHSVNSLSEINDKAFVVHANNEIFNNNASGNIITGGLSVVSPVAVNSSLSPITGFNYIKDIRLTPFYVNKYYQVEKDFTELTNHWYTEFNTAQKRNDKFAEINKKINIYEYNKLDNPPCFDTYYEVKVFKIN